VALGIPVLLLTAIFPLMSRPRRDGERLPSEMVVKVFAVAAICGAWMSICMALGASFIMNVIGGAETRGAASVLRIQGAVLTATFVSTSGALCLISLRRYRTMILVSSSALLLDVVLGVVLIPSLGARGGALADVITESLVAATITALVRDLLPRDRSSWSFLPALALAAAVASAVVFAPIGPVASVAVATFLYFATLLLMRALPEELIHAARARWPDRREGSGVKDVAT
jgi:O-antigen/teichoic acid export membrane protein